MYMYISQRCLLMLVLEIFLDDSRDNQYEFGENRVLDSEHIVDFQADPFVSEQGLYEESNLDPYAAVNEDTLGSLSLEEQMRSEEHNLQSTFEKEGLGESMEEFRY